MKNKTSERIKQAITKSELTLLELEKKTGIPKSAIQRYASGDTKKLPIDRIKLIANATGVTPSFLMGWENDDIYDVQTYNDDYGNDTMTEFDRVGFQWGKTMATIVEELSLFTTSEKQTVLDFILNFEELAPLIDKFNLLDDYSKDLIITITKKEFNRNIKK